MKSKCTSFYCPYCGSLIDLCDDEYTEVFKTFNSDKDTRSCNINSVELVPPPGLTALYPILDNASPFFSYFNLDPWSDKLLKYENEETFKMNGRYKETYSVLRPPNDEINFAPGHKMNTLRI
ncbi:hypothetical protein CM240_3356 [Clostridium bornimense]|uniref:Uncharacterized protein n=1 Tax=Clostridium bornimense TaxID=1216932 RepID=W6S172_9CLOT|nr:hypothetical protein [Clostridium bornimense]CDM70473.1 hypothetical protein CM240_3356 [Clostridium bornimense]